MGNLIRVKQLETAKPLKWLSDGDPRGAGQLYARRNQSGRVIFYFRYTGSDGKRVQLPIGEWSETNDGELQLTLAGARQKANELRSRYQAGETDLRAAIQMRKEQQAEAVRESQRKKEQEAEVARRAQEQTLGALLEAYVAHLKHLQKPSARAVETSIHRHIRDAFPKIWKLPADRVDDDSIAPVLDLITEAGKLREAAKVRSYLRAAFSAAIRARSSGAAVGLRKFGIRHNPLRDVPTIEGASKARSRVLDLAELQAYWRRIQVMQGPEGALLRFHLLTGGQRIQQLVRLTVRDLDGDAAVISDSKGRRTEARRHLVPLLPEAKEALEQMGAPATGPYLLTLTMGEKPVTHTTFRHALQSVVAEMVGAGEAREPFTPGDLRRTVETRLAAAGINGEIRAHLQSHGLHGVQHKHYNMHDYAAEKRQALELLYTLMTAKQSGATTRNGESG
ncbi:MAG: integrase arm-type DNA-binding domain-containing protein [Gammaproteobacteria bacterium]